MRREGFYIIRCPRCGRYTFAPIQQKTRLCVYCQRIFKVNPLTAQYVEDAKTAQTRVRLYQTGKHHDEFIEAVEKSRAHITSLVPSEPVSLKTIQEGPSPPNSSQRRILERLLHKYARTVIDLHVLEEKCQKENLPWEWVSQQLETLIRSGHLVCPKPWQIRLVSPYPTLTANSTPRSSITTLARQIGEIIREADSPIDPSNLMAKLQNRDATIAQIEEALERLKVQGYVFKTRKGTYRWIGPS